MIWIDTFCTLAKSVRDESRTQCGLISPLEKSHTRQARQKGSPAGSGDVPAASAVETWRARLRHYARRKRTRNAGRLKSQIVPRARTTNPRRWAGAVTSQVTLPPRRQPGWECEQGAKAAPATRMDHGTPRHRRDVASDGSNSQSNSVRHRMAGAQMAERKQPKFVGGSITEKAKRFAEEVIRCFPGAGESLFIVRQKPSPTSPRGEGIGNSKRARQRT